MSIENILNLTEDELVAVIGSALYGGVRPLVDQGMTPQMALRLVSATYITEVMGHKALEDMGIPWSTAKRWRATMRKYAEHIPDAPPNNVLEDVVRYLQAKEAERGQQAQEG
jgi:hypothetical protein